MALIVEDGSGMANAESYLSVADFTAYCTARGLTFTADTEAVTEQKLRIATGYIDTVRRYKGSRITAAQALEFPRDGLTDWGGLAITGVPARVKNACAELAYKAFTENLYVDLDRGGMVSSQSVGPISVSYAEGAPAGKSFTAAIKLLEPYFRDAKDIGAPYFVPVDPLFERSTHDMPEME
jgi:hypothetical protein